jgi:glycosyltransferase involved in cell wall biosynthesis
MKKTLVTIGMPIYKGGRNNGSLLIRCLESIKAQTFTDFKVVMVNNDSPDNTEGIIDNTVKDDNRFEYYRNAENYGYFYNLYRMFTNCDTKYYFMLHFDSYLASTYVERCVKALEKDSNISIAYSQCQFFDDNNNLLDIYKDDVSFDQEDPVERYLGILSRLGWCTPFHGIMRHKFVAKHLFRTGSTSNAAFDNEFLSLMAFEGKFFQIGAPLFYRLKDNYQVQGENFEDHYNRLYAKNAHRPYAIYLPFCTFIKDHCKDIINFNLSPEQKDRLIHNTVNILSKRYETRIQCELKRLINHITTGDYKHEDINIEEAPPNKYKFFDFVFLAELVDQLSFARLLKPSFPQINLAQAFLSMYLGNYKEALFYVEQELLLNPTDTLSQKIKTSLLPKV